MAPGLDLSEDNVRRNPHPDFKLVEKSRPDWRQHDTVLHTKTQNPDWRYGDGDTDAQNSLKKEHVEIDPYEPGRDRILNYKLLLSAVVPRPIGWISTCSKDGTIFRTANQENGADTYDAK
ncbi:hypothetical protein H2200_003436 [Cladophialophora chaetospira]|uniref:Uncharacterized protein n=1 Tax=Cladophialophora chaetospira TaxID=386627 RepID=A0AA38XI81_9EURO|nr:hypothetical protein H2200_003436 [Cladophialophora chaetospira]